MGATLESIAQQIEKQKAKGERLNAKAKSIAEATAANDKAIASLEKSHKDLTDKAAAAETKPE